MKGKQRQPQCGIKYYFDGVVLYNIAMNSLLKVGTSLTILILLQSLGSVEMPFGLMAGRIIHGGFVVVIMLYGFCFRGLWHSI
jgi:hypothetical protein